LIYAVSIEQTSVTVLFYYWCAVVVCVPNSALKGCYSLINVMMCYVMLHLIDASIISLM